MTEIEFPTKTRLREINVWNLSSLARNIIQQVNMGADPAEAKLALYRLVNEASERWRRNDYNRVRGTPISEPPKPPIQYAYQVVRQAKGSVQVDEIGAIHRSLPAAENDALKYLHGYAPFDWASDGTNSWYNKKFGVSLYIRTLTIFE